MFNRNFAKLKILVFWLTKRIIYKVITDISCFSEMIEIIKCPLTFTIYDQKIYNLIKDMIDEHSCFYITINAIYIPYWNFANNLT